MRGRPEFSQSRTRDVNPSRGSRPTPRGEVVLFSKPLVDSRFRPRSPCWEGAPRRWEVTSPRLETEGSKSVETRHVFRRARRFGRGIMSSLGCGRGLLRLRSNPFPSILDHDLSEIGLLPRTSWRAPGLSIWGGGPCSCTQCLARSRGERVRWPNRPMLRKPRRSDEPERNGSSGLPNFKPR